MDIDELWNKALSALLKNVEPDNPKSVFLHLLTPFGIFGDQYILLAENSQVESWVGKNYIREIEQAVSEASGTQLHIGMKSKTAFEQPKAHVDTPSVQQTPIHVEPQNDQLFTQIQQEQTQPATPDWVDTFVSPADLAPEKAEPAPTTSAQPMNPEERELLERCTFETFVVGQSNEFARGAALAVAEQPGKRFNPLFIYGKSGLGKTHLLLSIANYIAKNTPHLKTLYVPSDTFTDDFTESLRMHNMPEFDAKYNNVDVLLIDDVQRLENREETINQLFNIFNEMTANNKQVVLSADRSPKEIKLDERYRSRFMQGLLADIKPPDFETRLAIIRNLIVREEEKSPFYAVISEDVQNWLAEIAVPTIRDIQGAITRLVGHMSLGKKTSLSVEEAKEILQDFFPDRANRQVSIAVIQNEVERYFDVSHEDIISSKRSKNITYPRHIAMYLSRYMTEESLESIGKKFGNRDHTTVMHSVNKIESDQKNNRLLFDQIEQLTIRIKERS